MTIIFILVNPARPENIGAAARAMKTMGFTSLRLVNPAEHLSEPARRLAHGANDILETAQVFDTPDAASADIDLLVGTSAKHKHSHQDYLPPEKLTTTIQAKGDTVKSVAIVFGGEESGLSKADLSCCHLVSSIPLAAPYPSLNLAQAVMVYAYALTGLSLTPSENIDQIAGQAEFEVLNTRTKNLLEQIGINPGTQLHGRILERLNLLGSTDIHLLLSFMERLEPKLNKD